jgi:hypothetical protein
MPALISDGYLFHNPTNSETALMKECGVQKWAILYLGMIAMTCAGMNALQAQGGPPGGPPGKHRGGPPQAMVDACLGKSSGAACTAVGPQGRNMSGTCFAPPTARGAPLACRPSGGPQGGQSERQNETTSAPAADTSAVLCRVSSSTQNTSVNLPSHYTWSCANGQRTLVGNGIPEHAVGAFPNANNPNKVSEQKVSFTATLNPALQSVQGAWVKDSGMALNGIKFDPGTGGSCPSGVASKSACSMDRGPGEWRMEALGQSSFNFGVDANNAHVQPDGSYHYHGLPTGSLMAATLAGRQMQLIGWAADGFPMYALFGYDNAKSAVSPLRKMRGSFRLKSVADSGRPSTSLIPLGAFMQDYEYAAGSGDLDECNGRFGVTPEFPMGIYHYFVTETYPYIQRCVKGAFAQTDRGGPPPARRP